MPTDKPFNCTFLLMDWPKVSKLQVHSYGWSRSYELHASVFCSRHRVLLIWFSKQQNREAMEVLVLLCDAVGHAGVVCRLGCESQMLFRMCE